MSQDVASTSDSISEMAMNKKIWGDDKQNLSSSQALAEHD